MSQVIADMNLVTYFRAPLSILSSALQKRQFSNRAVVSYSDNQIQILARKDIDGCFQLVTKIQVKRIEVNLQSTLWKNGECFVINSNEIKKNLYRSFIKTSFQPTLKIIVNQQGRIAFKMHTFLSSQVQFKQKKYAEKISRFIENTYTQMMDSFLIVFQKIKFLIEPVYQKATFQNPDRLQRLDIIKNNCRFTFVKPSFVQSYGARGKDNHHNLPLQFISQNQLEATNFFDMKVQSKKIEEDKKFHFFAQLWQSTLKLQKVQDTGLYNNFSLVKIKGMFKSNLKTPQPKASKNQIEPQEIISPISICEPDKVQWVKIYEGGFGALFKANLSFFHIQQTNNKQKKFLHEKPIQKILVMKVDRLQGGRISRIQIQKIILKSLKSKKCRYLPKFYQTSQKINNFSHTLFTEYYPFKSINHWFSSFGEFSSLFSKLAILMFICYGLYFLHQNGIIHRDFKTSNILIDSRMVIKLIDFGESYSKKVQSFIKQKGSSSYKPGFTLPYSPPQIFSKIAIYLQGLKESTYDMFSLGFIIYEVIFNKCLLSQIGEQKLKWLYLQQIKLMETKTKQFFQQSRYKSIIKQKILLASQNLSYYGPQELLTPILNIVQRCLDPRIQNRPHLQWVINIIRQIYGNLLDFYSI